MKFTGDDLLKTLIPEFVELWIEDIDTEGKEILSAKKPDDLFRFGHTVKGSCLQFGFNDLADIGVRIMKAAKETDWASASSLISELRTKFIEIQDYLKKNK